MMMPVKFMRFSLNDVRFCLDYTGASRQKCFEKKSASIKMKAVIRDSR